LSTFKFIILPTLSHVRTPNYPTNIKMNFPSHVGFNFTPTIHDDIYTAIDPTKSDLSQPSKVVLVISSLNHDYTHLTLRLDYRSRARYWPLYRSAICREQSSMHRHMRENQHRTRRSRTFHHPNRCRHPSPQDHSWYLKRATSHCGCRDDQERRGQIRHSSQQCRDCKPMGSYRWRQYQRLDPVLWH